MTGFINKPFTGDLNVESGFHRKVQRPGTRLTRKLGIGLTKSLFNRLSLRGKHLKTDSTVSI